MAGLERGGRLRDITRQGEEQRDGVLGCGDVVPTRRIHDDDATPGGGLDIDVINADAGPTDHAQVWGCRNNLRRDSCPASNNQTLVRSDPLGKFRFGQARLDGTVDIRLGLQPLHPLRGERVGNKHFV